MSKLPEQVARVLEFMAVKHIPLLEQNTITERSDASCRMAEVMVNGQSIMLGNYHDFHPGCHGLDLPNFASPSSLVALFKNAITLAGKKSVIVLDDHWIYK